ncbi:MAG: hypothetical protein HRU28_19275 [Rhizobiales bacterium]|nr:hypothetical protein [Hyphomicrobiales bacterium]
MKLLPRAARWVASLFSFIISFTIYAFGNVIHYAQSVWLYFKPTFYMRTETIDWLSLYQTNKSISIKIRQYVAEKLEFAHTEDLEIRTAN